MYTFVPLTDGKPIYGHNLPINIKKQQGGKIELADGSRAFMLFQNTSTALLVG